MNTRPMDYWRRYHLGELLYKNSRHSGSVDKIKKLLQQGALVNWSDVYSDEWTALHEACYVNKTGVVKVLLEYKADVNQQTEFGYTALHLACYWGSIECVQLLMETRQCNLGIMNRHGKTALGEAIHGRRLNIVKFFINVCIVDVNGPVTKIGDTALGLAVREDSLDVIKYLIIECSVDSTAPATKSGDTALGLVVREGNLVVIKCLITECRIDINAPVTKNGDTALGLAICLEKLDLVKYLVTECGVDINDSSIQGGILKLVVDAGDVDFLRVLVSEYSVDVKASITESGDTALGLAVRKEKLGVITFLVTECCVNVNISVTESGDTALGLAVREGKIDVIKYLVTKCSADVEAPVTKIGDTALGLAVCERKLSVVKYLVIECSVNINDPALLLKLVIGAGDVDFLRHLVSKYSLNVNAPITESGDTALGLAVLEEKLSVIKYLVTECSVDVTDDLLLRAQMHKSMAIFHYLLTDCHCNPNIKDDNGRTPLALAKDSETIQLLLKNGATSQDVYTHHRKTLGNVFSKDSLINPVKMFVIGHGGEGKSTLIEAMEHEPTIFAPFVNLIIKPRKVEGVSQKTAGIIPRIFKSRFYGDVQFHDFAGQEAYYSSHAAIIKSAVDTCPPIFVIVAGLHRDDTITIHSISYWLGIVANQCTNIEGKAPLIVVCSHADLVSDKDEIGRKERVISHTVGKFPAFDLVQIVSMDCRFSNSNGMKTLRRTVGTSCDLIRSRLSVSLNSHMFLIYLLDKYSNEITIMLENLQRKILSDLNSQRTTVKQKNALSFIPTTIPRLVEICIQLSDNSHILFLHNISSPGKSFIVIDRIKLLAEINGTMFAPKDFKQHCDLATSTGVVPRSKLAAHFPNFNIDIPIGFLSHLELAVPIEDSEVLVLINQHLSSTGESTAHSEDGYVFCPALIRLAVPDSVFEHLSDHVYHFCWILSCVESTDFFDARFLHVLILRIALSFGLAPELAVDAIPAIQRRCSVWTTGVCWCTPQGVKVLVGVVAKKNVVVLVQAHDFCVEALKMRSTVLNKVRDTARELCPTITSREFLLPPNDVTYPLDFSKSTRIFSLTCVALTTVNQEGFVVSTTGAENIRLIDLLTAEVYVDLGENIIQPLFNERDPVHNTKVSDRFLSALSSSWSKNHQLVGIICSAFAKESDLTTLRSSNNLEGILKAWRDKNNASYKSLRQILDPLSVFAGRNPLELAGVPLMKFSEISLPPSPPKVACGELGGSLTIEDLKRRTRVNDTLLDTEIIEHDLQLLAGCFDNVDDYLDQLGLTAGQQTDIKDLAYRQITQSAMREALRKWRDRNPYAATFRALVSISLHLSKGVVANELCKYIAANVSESADTH